MDRGSRVRSRDRAAPADHRRRRRERRGRKHRSWCRGGKRGRRSAPAVRWHGVTKATGGASGTGGSAVACTGCKVIIASECQSGADTKTIHVTVDVSDDRSGRFRWRPSRSVTGSCSARRPILLSCDRLRADVSRRCRHHLKVRRGVARGAGANEYLEVGFSADAQTLTMFDDAAKSSCGSSGRTTPTRSISIRRWTTRTAPVGRTPRPASPTRRTSPEHQRRPRLGHQAPNRPDDEERRRAPERRVVETGAAPSTPALFRVASRGRRCAGSYPRGSVNDSVESAMPPRSHIAHTRFLGCSPSPSGRLLRALPPPQARHRLPRRPRRQPRPRHRPHHHRQPRPRRQPRPAGRGQPPAPAAAVVSDWNAAPTNGSAGVNVPKLSGE